MIKVKSSGSWILGPVLLAVFCISCEKNEISGDYSSVEGIYTCQESSTQTGVRQYIVEIDKVNNAENLYIILNFHNKGQNEFLYTELDGDNFLISNQFISDIRVDGEGTVDEEFKSIQLNYVTDDGAYNLNYYATYTR